MKNTIQIIVMGVSGSGKSTVGEALSKKLKIDFFDGDEFHTKENIEKMSQGIKLNDNDRKPWLKNISKFLKDRKKSTIIACSALKKDYRDLIQEDAEVTFVFLNGSKETIKERLMDRKDHFMPSSLLDSQFMELEEPKDAIYVNINQDVSKIVEDIIEKLN